MKLLEGFLAVLVAFALQAAEVAPPNRDAKPACAEQNADRIWIVPEYYGALTKESPYPNFPLITRGDPNFARAGVLGQEGTTIVFNRHGEDFGIQHGIRLTAGGWLTADRQWGAEVAGLFQPEVQARFAVALDRAHRLAIPYFDATFPRDSASYYDPGFNADFPDIYNADSAAISITNKQQFWGVGGMGLYNIRRGRNIGIDFKFGVRSLNLKDEFSFRQDVTTQLDQPIFGFSLDDGTAFPGHFVAKDIFRARNCFLGADLGAKFTFTYGRFRAEVQPKIALGGTRQTVVIRGYTAARDSETGSIYVLNGGLWALDSNIGQRDRTRFAIVPEIDLKVGVEINKHLEFQAGYNFTYWSEVVRAGDQVSRVLNPDRIPLGYDPNFISSSLVAPTFSYHSTDFWAHGITAGFKVKF